MAIRRLASLCAAATLAGASQAAAAPPPPGTGPALRAPASANHSSSGLTHVATRPAAGGSASPSSSTSRAAGPIVATVNGEPITEAEWLARMRLMAGKNALDNLVREKIIRQEARKNGVGVTPAEIAAQAAELENSYRQQFGTPARFNEVLKQQGLSLAGFRDFIRYSAELRAIQQKLAKKLGEKVQVSDKELQDLYEKSKFQFVQPAEVKIAQIMLNFTGLDDASQNKTKADAAALLEKVKAPGADFAALAKQYSQDTDTKDKGGELLLKGFSPYGQLFDQIVMAAPVGVIDQPVRSYKAYHIVKVLDKQPQRTRPFDEVK